MYRPPNTNITQFSNNVTNIANQARAVKGKSSPEIVIGMDHNIDLLKGVHHILTHKFIEELLSINLLPTITPPTCITNHSATLIDNIYISDQLHRNFESAILMHDPLFHLESH